MSGPTAPPPPPAPAYQPPPTYAAAPASAPPSSSGVKLPAWLDLWTMLGLLVILVGAIFILVGFLFGDAAASQLGSGGSASTYQSDLEAFFVWTGVGIFLTIFGWLFRVIVPLWQGQKRASASSTLAAAPAPQTTAAPATAAAAPASPACANCGKPTTYIAQYGRYYCYACARYV
jgi:hypothetical protein